MAILVASAVLIRNELLVAAGIFAIAIAIYEVRERRTRKTRLRSYIWAYGLPLAIASLLIGGAYWRSHVQGQVAWNALQAKEELNLCEYYAFNYQQRYPARVPGDAFLTCASIMQRDFGRPMPTFFQAIAVNPSAMAGFVFWNVRQLPSGLQIALFNATSTGVNPCCRRVTDHHSTPALVL